MVVFALLLQTTVRPPDVPVQRPRVEGGHLGELWLVRRIAILLFVLPPLVRKVGLVVRGDDRNLALARRGLSV